MPDSVAITIAAATQEGLPALDPLVTVDILQVLPDSRQVARQILRNFNGRGSVTVPMPDGFPSWQVNVSFSRYDAVSGFFFMPRGNASPSYSMPLTRLPAAWTPQFTALSALTPARFQPFQAIVAVSNNVDLKHGPAVGDLNMNYDGLADPAQVQAKMALLNLFAVASDVQDPVGGVPWFQYVRKFVRIDQERFIAEVDVAMFENVQTVLNGLGGEFQGQGYYTEPSIDLLLHVDNLPPQYGGSQNIQKMITIKKDFEQGNLQLTLSLVKVAGAAVYLLDCDLDEHRNLVLHSLDVVKHLFNGGTSPVTMHEYIVRDSAENAGGVSTIDLGYRLV